MLNLALIRETSFKCPPAGPNPFDVIFNDLSAHFRKNLGHYFTDIGFKLIKLLSMIRLNTIYRIAP